MMNSIFHKLKTKPRLKWLLIAGLIMLVFVLALAIYLTVNTGSHSRTGNEHAGHTGAVTGAPATMTDQPLLVVDIPLEKQQQIGVKYAAAARRALDYPLRAVARVSVNENSLFIISTRYSGFVEQLFAAETGQYITAGQGIAAIYSPDLLAAQTEYVNILKTTSTASGDAAQTTDLLAAARDRISLLGVDNSFINNLERTGQPSRTITVTAPAGGYIMQRQVLPGSQVLAGQPLLTMADLSTVWVIADIYEQDLALVHTGQPVSLSFEAWPDTRITTTIDYIYPMLDAQTRTAKVRLTVANSSGKLKPQMYGAVSVFVRLPETLSIPEDAVLNTGSRKIVYVDLGEGRLRQRVVTTGYSAGGYVQITAGLAENERVATAANFLIDSETRLRGEVAP